MKNSKNYIKYFASLLMFGMNGIVASYIHMNSYEIVLTRALIGSLLLIFIFIITKQRVRLLDNKKHLLFVFISGIAIGISWMFLYEAYRQIGVSIATLACYSGPVIIMILSPILFHEKLTLQKIAGFLSVLIGMFCVNLQALNEGGTTWGVLCGIMSAVTYAIMVIFNKKATSIKGLENSMWQLIIGFLTVSVFVIVKQGFSITIEPNSILPVLILGIVNTGIGCYFYFSSIVNLPVQTVAICGYLEPLSAVIFSVLLLNEPMGPVEIIGAALIIGGAAYGELPKPEKGCILASKS
ncbi:MAG: EamA family transporter [Clostridiaceae bacterium]|nr:EamA family transporter [Clostridiaceae bacterium]